MEITTRDKFPFQISLNTEHIKCPRCMVAFLKILPQASFMLLAIGIQRALITKI